MMSHPTLLEVVESVRYVANQNPNFQYHGSDSPIGKIPIQCAYIEDGDFSCLMAMALGRVIKDIPELKSYLSRREGEGISEIIYRICGLDEENISKDDSRLITWLGMVQNFQDQNNPWGRCVILGDIWLQEQILKDLKQTLEDNY
jgi:hypothetical protein